MNSSQDLPVAGWYADPAGSGGERYWDGGTWSQVTRPAGGLTQGLPMPQAQSPYSGMPMQGGYAPATVRQPALAGFWWRVLATILDNIMLAAPLAWVQQLVAGDALDTLNYWIFDWIDAMSIGAVPPPLPDGVTESLTMLTLVSALIPIVYRTVLVALQGGTLGQLITGLRVLPEDGGIGTKPRWGTSALRAVTAVVFNQIPVLNIVDPLVMLASPKKQTLHDKIAHTVVIKK